MFARPVAPLVVVAAVVALVGCGGDDGGAAPASSGIPAAASPATAAVVVVPPVVSPAEGQALIDDGAVVIDVRTPEEYADGHLADAQLIDLQAPGFEAAVGQLDPTATYVVYCRSGNRSAQASAIMAQLGFTSVYDLGGIQAWQAAGLTVVTD